MHAPITAHLYAPLAGAVLFVVQRAADGWIALDLAGAATDAAREGAGAPIVVARGGPAYSERIFALHDRLEEVVAGRALAIGDPHGPRFAFGGDLLGLLAEARTTAFPRLRLFRGLTVLRDGDPRFARGLRATPELVFATRAEHARAAFEAACAVHAGSVARPYPASTVLPVALASRVCEPALLSARVHAARCTAARPEGAGENGSVRARRTRR